MFAGSHSRAVCGACVPQVLDFPEICYHKYLAQRIVDHCVAEQTKVDTDDLPMRQGYPDGGWDGDINRVDEDKTKEEQLKSQEEQDEDTDYCDTV